MIITFFQGVYPEKMSYYIKENILVKSLSKVIYDHNPNFTNFVKASNLPFTPYFEFMKDDVISHCVCYIDRFLKKNVSILCVQKFKRNRFY